ncbi:MULTISPECIES: AAA family ATPase [Vibrio]|uniref:AAA family ATPase n=1 Tax=Vibrio cortegadensis TaxID=1328770 RepID=A0ABV4M3K7_9VIBR|nr:AAA family ATPase [Vibrio genomosp. F6]TKF20588.1 type II secretion protein [Vibrio genomosp. F6]
MGEAVKLTMQDDNQLRLKTNLCIWVLYSNDRFKLHMGQELEKCRNLTFEMISMYSLDVGSLKQLTPPDLIFVETGPNWAQKIVILQEYEPPTSEYEASLVVFGDESDNGALKIALRIGAADFVSDRVVLSELFPLLKNVAEEKIASRNMGELFIFMNTKGGSGASTLALNTAMEIASYHKDEVLLLDLDMQFGVISDYLNVAPSYSISDAITNVADLDESSLSSMVTKHPSGLHMLSFGLENSNEDFDQAKNIGKLLPTLREFYPYLIVDLSRGIDKLFSSVISSASKVFLITQQNLVAVKNTTRISRALTFEYGITREQIELIVNRYEKRQSIKIKDIEQTINGVKVHMIPNDFKVAIESANLGKPFIESRKSSPITKSVVEFSHLISPPEESKKGWLKRLFS